MSMLRSVALAALVMVSLVPDRADACVPEAGCGDRICNAAIAFVDATVAVVGDDGTTVRLTPLAIFGDAAELAVGVEATLEGRVLSATAADIGQRRYVYLERSNNALVVSTVKDPADPDFTECLGAEATNEMVAAQILRPDCNLELIEHRPPSTGCPDDTCNAGGGASALTLVAIGAFIALPRRRGSHRRATPRLTR
jgi:hypothetical protein